MINISGYVSENDNVNKNKTWFDVKYKILVTKEVKYRNYYSVLSRYENHVTNFYLLLHDNKLEGCGKVKQDDYGRIKIRMTSEQNTMFGLDRITRNSNVEISKIDGDEDSELYEIYPI